MPRMEGTNWTALIPKEFGVPTGVKLQPTDRSGQKTGQKLLYVPAKGDQALPEGLCVKHGGSGVNPDCAACHAHSEGYDQGRKEEAHAQSKQATESVEESLLLCHEHGGAGMVANCRACAAYTLGWNDAVAGERDGVES